MMIQLGTTVRQLRQRDGRTQEAVAEALGVSTQTVSRWENGGGYPDMELIPSIANYFHVTIDELFGYNSDHSNRKQEIIQKADEQLHKLGDMSSTVVLLEEAAREFPNDGEILFRLGSALILHAQHVDGIHVSRNEPEDAMDYDIAHHQKSEYLSAGIRALENALASGLEGALREAALVALSIQYGLIGADDKAEALASKQPGLAASRECLLPAGTAGEKRTRYRGEALMALLRQMEYQALMAVGHKISLRQSEDGLNILLALTNLYESIFSDGRCGMYHSDLFDLYYSCAMIAARFGDLTRAVQYFGKGVDHMDAYNAARCAGEYRFTAPIVNQVTANSAFFPALDAHWLSAQIKKLPTNLSEILRKDSRYSHLFT